MKGQVWKVWTLFILNLSTWRGVPTRPANNNWNEQCVVNFSIIKKRVQLAISNDQGRTYKFRIKLCFYVWPIPLSKCFMVSDFSLSRKMASLCVPHFIKECFVSRKLWTFSLIFDEWTTHLITSLSREWHRHVQLPLECSLLMRIQVMSKNQRRSFIFLIYFWSKKKEVRM